MSHISLLQKKNETAAAVTEWYDVLTLLLHTKPYKRNDKLAYQWDVPCISRRAYIVMIHVPSHTLFILIFLVFFVCVFVPYTLLLLFHYSHNILTLIYSHYSYMSVFALSWKTSLKCTTKLNSFFRKWMTK